MKILKINYFFSKVPKPTKLFIEYEETAKVLFFYLLKENEKSKMTDDIENKFDSIVSNTFHILKVVKNRS